MIAKRASMDPVDDIRAVGVGSLFDKDLDGC